MCRDSCMIDEMRRFNRYLVFYGNDEGRSGIKGIRSDAPPELIDEFIEWYRDRNRYPNGRLRPKTASLIRELVIEV